MAEVRAGSSRVRGKIDNGRVASWLVLAVPVLIALVGAWTYRWVQDDAYINFRIVGNLFAGHGPVFNVGERVEVYSDPLWLFTLAAAHGILPFISLEWLSVAFGLGFTGAGVVLGGRAIQRLGVTRGDGLVLPVGLLIFSVVAGVWEFSTSGLEMSMVFGWIGFSFWLLVRTEERRKSGVWCGFVVGLGTLIRPEVILMSVVFLVALLLVLAAPGWQGPTGRGRRFAMPLLAAVTLPVIYELWRMAYFGMVVANTALAKSAGSSWWSQGFAYLWNFVSPYTLWLPAILAVLLAAPRVAHWWRNGDRIGVVVLVTPAIAGMVDALYVIHIGGDYQHARLLLPAFMALCLGIYAVIPQVRSILIVSLLGIVIWSVVCAGWLRSTSGAILGTNGIDNERNIAIEGSGHTHPIDVSDWNTSTERNYVRTAKAAKRNGRQAMLVVLDPYEPWIPKIARPAESALPFSLAVNMGNVGVDGLQSGPDVYVFDFRSLANPIGSHTTLSVRGRPGGDKVIGPAWMIGRFGVRGEQFPTGTASAQSIVAARKALSCGPLHAYLHAITNPLTFSQAMSNIWNSLSYTTMSFSADPEMAERQLCK